MGAAGLIILMVACAAAAAVAALLVRRYAPFAGGSGIPHVEAVLTGRLAPAPLVLVPVKFIGGVLAIGGGLALGREGPSVQMGASIAHSTALLFRRGAPDCRVMLGAGAGAGLATAFNAPLAGSIFVLEELLRRFDTRVTVATLGASAGAITVSRWILGDAPDLTIGPLPYAAFGHLPLFLVLGVIAGILGAAYNRATTGLLDAGGRIRLAPVELRAGVIGALVGALAWFAPGAVGGGDRITQFTLTALPPVSIILPVFLVRFVLGPVSYAARTPGGLFAPMLVIGAQAGVMFAHAVSYLVPRSNPDATALGLVGMAAFFAAVVRAPVTGIVLVTEMTGGFSMLLPMLAACLPAMVIPALMRNTPIYESLFERTVGPRSGHNSGAAA